MAAAIAGKFEFHVPKGFDKHKRKILYVGKATAGKFDEENVIEDSFNGKSPFWSFAREISHLADPACTDLSNLAWSNIFKQGVTKGNPDAELAEGQRAEAIVSLQAETRSKPFSLILLVNAGYYEEIVKEAFGIDDGEEGEKALIRTNVPGEEKFDLWSRKPYGGFPQIVWMYHPQGKNKAYTDAALDLISEQMHWPRS